MKLFLNNSDVIEMVELYLSEFTQFNAEGMTVVTTAEGIQIFLGEEPTTNRRTRKVKPVVEEAVVETAKEEEVPVVVEEVAEPTDVAEVLEDISEEIFDCSMTEEELFVSPSVAETSLFDDLPQVEETFDASKPLFG